jgi:hypothetical protein
MSGRSRSKRRHETKLQNRSILPMTYSIQQAEAEGRSDDRCCRAHLAAVIVVNVARENAL